MADLEGGCPGKTPGSEQRSPQGLGLGLCKREANSKLCTRVRPLRLTALDTTKLPSFLLL